MEKNIINKLDKYILYFKKIKVNNKLKLLNIKKKFLNKNGIINNYLSKIKEINNKKEFGIKINYLKNKILNIIKRNNNNNKKNYNIKIDYDYLNLKKFKNNNKLGSKNPITIIKEKIFNLLNNLNFNYIESNEIVDDWNNFTALNFPKYHPSRDMQDTYFINNKYLLRTHTTSIQIKYMINKKPPIKIFTIGKVYRNETITNKSFNMFHQVEIFYVYKNVNIINLKNIIEYLINNLFNNKYKYRYRFSYFPFTNPSFEVDIYYNKKWIEIIGCGLINKIILKNVNINYNKYSGFALGIGIERIAMIIYKIKDIRELFKNDIRIIKQFKNNIYLIK
ncbi:MAG: phenylalanine--tRNA ligase alpha subunit [Flavobacteriales endosymbiont of Rhyzopertha dominica]|nr:MAG: phenylalanine--tRNA ligase subunit alpha [Candidatus Shikimatogenerans bostrichidophilus]